MIVGVNHYLNFQKYGYACGRGKIKDYWSFVRQENLTSAYENAETTVCYLNIQGMEEVK